MNSFYKIITKYIKYKWIARLGLPIKQELKSKSPKYKCKNCDGMPCNLSMPYCPNEINK